MSKDEEIFASWSYTILRCKWPPFSISYGFVILLALTWHLNFSRFPNAMMLIHFVTDKCNLMTNVLRCSPFVSRLYDFKRSKRMTTRSLRFIAKMAYVAVSSILIFSFLALILCENLSRFIFPLISDLETFK